MKIVVTGGRNYWNKTLVEQVLNWISPKRVAAGDATGADTLAKDWAQLYGKDFTLYKADWGTFGNYAGPRRNKKMLYEFRPDLVIAFPGGRGTTNCVNTALGLGITVLQVLEP